MGIIKKDILSIEIGDKISGVNEVFTALESTFYFQIGTKCIPKKGFLGCPNATLVWALKACRLITNGRYEERETPIYGSDYVIVFSLINTDLLRMQFVIDGKSVYDYKGNYLSIANTILSAAEKSSKISKEYEYNTMAEHVIENEIRLMKKHIEKHLYTKT